MKKIIVLIMAVITLFACGSDDNALSSLGSSINGTWKLDPISVGGIQVTQIIELKNGKISANTLKTEDNIEIIQDISIGTYTIDEDSIYITLTEGYSSQDGVDYTENDYTDFQTQATAYELSDDILYIGEYRHTKTSTTVIKDPSDITTESSETTPDLPFGDASKIDSPIIGTWTSPGEQNDLSMDIEFVDDGTYTETGMFSLEGIFTIEDESISMTMKKLDDTSLPSEDQTTETYDFEIVDDTLFLSTTMAGSLDRTFVKKD